MINLKLKQRLRKRYLTKRAVIGSSLIGNIVEYYDFGIYSVFADTIGKLFFPNFEEYIQLMFSFAIFAIGFFMRPLGGVLFGHIGDKFGRKTALTISIVGMGICTILMGSLPSYSQIGMIAPIMLTVIRMFQGMCIGGEGAGSAIFIIEHFGEKKIGLIGSIVMASNVMGTLLAILVGILIERLFGIDDFTWRYGFFIGGLMGFVGLLMRYKIKETPVFEEMKKGNNIEKFPLKRVLMERWQSILIIASFASLATASTYMIRGFFNVYFAEMLELNKETALHLVSLALMALVIALPVFGYIADKFGHKKYIYSAVFIYVLSVTPIFNIIIDNAHHDITNVIYGITLLGILFASVAAPYYPFAVKFFTPALRYSGIALGWNVGNALFGGTAPLISTFLVMQLGYIAPAYYLTFVALMFIIISFLNRRFLANQ
ncbi:MFS transporter [Candidatus Bandiella euplotis]|uniref:MFS transporter n=1 Tax=Candidatus Bandiella euplotis TaxID=1664265 RepID=UPI002B2645AA|nr:MFS transporter [Candidatus Bandiella woodruffii]